MRDIVFRGKRKDNGEWAYGWLVTMPNMDENHRPLCIFDDNTQEWHEVDPESVGQRTDMTDRNGNWIFEGDILKCDAYPDDELKVQFNYTGFGVVFKKLGYEDYLYFYEPENFEIIS